MRTHTANLTLLIALTLGVTDISRAAEPLKVAVKVSSDDADLRDRLASAVRNELRTFKDVAVVTDGPRQFEILVIGAGDSSSFAAGFTSVEIGVGFVTSLGEKAVGLRALCDAYMVRGGGAEQLHEDVVSAVASFDSHCAEPFRQAQQKKQP